MELSLWVMAWRQIRSRPVVTGTTIMIIAVSVALMLSISMASEGIKRGISESSAPYGMIVGSKGSETQLIFNTIFLLDRPLGNVPWDFYEAIKADPRVQAVVPFALGDNFQGYRIVGTDERFFEMRSRPGAPPAFVISQGRRFERPFEAVLGAKTAQDTGLRVGDTFVSSHGTDHHEGLESDEHREMPYTVVGIMRPTHTPVDRGIFVHYESYWRLHEHESAVEHDAIRAAPSDQVADTPHMLSGSDSGDLSHGITAFLVHPKGYVELMQLYQEINASPHAQAVLPGQVLGKIFEQIGFGAEVLGAIAWLVLALAVITVCLTLYQSIEVKRKDFYLMRAIGASRLHVFFVVALEAVWLFFLGELFGWALSYVVYAFLAYGIGERLSIAMPFFFDAGAAWKLALLLIGGLVVAVITAFLTYRTQLDSALRMEAS
ncbi:ABC transporter permease [Hydrogenibacillus schlegelii]